MKSGENMHRNWI